MFEGNHNSVKKKPEEWQSLQMSCYLETQVQISALYHGAFHDEAPIEKKKLLFYDICPQILLKESRYRKKEKMPL